MFHGWPRPGLATGLAGTAPGGTGGQRAAVCGECVLLCAEIFAERES
jgi:hypothetical protein